MGGSINAGGATLTTCLQEFLEGTLNNPGTRPRKGLFFAYNDTVVIHLINLVNLSTKFVFIPHCKPGQFSRRT